MSVILNKLLIKYMLIRYTLRLDKKHNFLTLNVIIYIYYIHIPIYTCWLFIC